VEGQAEEAALVVGIGGHQRWRRQAAHVQRRCALQHAVAQHAQQAVLLDDGEPAGVTQREGGANVLLTRQALPCPECAADGGLFPPKDAASGLSGARAPARVLSLLGQGKIERSC